MRKANAQATNDQAQDQTAQEASAAPADSGAAALVPAAPAGTPAPDEHHGHGGLYVRTGAQRTLSERTEPATTTTDKEAQQ